MRALAKEITLTSTDLLKRVLEKKRVDEELVRAIEHREDEDAELEEIEVKPMSAIGLMTIVGSKGLSAEHVIIVGFDDVNMKWVTRNAFFVAISRARRSLHVLTALGAGGATEPHKFLTRLPDQNLEFCKYTKAKGREKCRGRLSFYEYIKSLNAARRPWRARCPGLYFFLGSYCSVAPTRERAKAGRGDHLPLHRRRCLPRKAGNLPRRRALRAQGKVLVASNGPIAAPRDPPTWKPRCSRLTYVPHWGTLRG